MRNCILLFVAAMATSYTFAQSNLDQFFNQYSDYENVNKVSLEGGLLKLVGNSSKEGEFLSKLNKLTAIWIEDYNPISKKEVNYLLKSLRKDRYERLITARSGTSNVKFMIQENGRYISSVILLIDDIDNFLLINLSGNLDYEDLSKMDIDINGMEHFKKLPKKRPTPKRA